MQKVEEGNKCPDWSCKDQNGQVRSSADLKGKKYVLYFYPKDLTPGCTNQACNLRDNYADLQAHGIEIFGVSADSERSHQKFIEKKELPFTLLADEDKKLIHQFGVWGEKSFMGRIFDGIIRVTYLVDEQGTVVKVIRKPKVKDHAREILEGFEIS